LKNEPYVDLLSGVDYEKLSDHDLVALNQNNRQSLKAGFYHLAFDFIKENSIYGNYLEFGVHRARTFRMALSSARMQSLNDMKFFAYDSFEGLPKSETHQNDLWRQGALCTSEEEFLKIVNDFGVYVDRVFTVKGFYDRVLNEEYVQSYLNAENKAALVTVDCDLYESAVSVLKFVEHIIQPGTIIYFDDFFVGHKGDTGEGVAKAFSEFKERSRYSFREYLNVGWWGLSFITSK